MDILSYLLGKNASGSAKGLKVEVVETLPQTGESNVLYLVPKQTAETSNVFDEYLYINNAWEKIGTTDIDLSGYVTDEELLQALANYQPKLVAGDNITIENNVISASGEETVYILDSDSNDTKKAKAKIVYDNYANGKMTKCYYYIYTNSSVNTLYELTGINNYFGNVLLHFEEVSNSNMVSQGKLKVTIKFFPSSGELTNFQISKSTIYPLYSYKSNSNTALALPTDNNVAYTPTAGSYNPATAKYAEEKAEAVRVQYSTMPTASADNLGKIVQYTGTTDSTYTNGHFYIVVSDGEETPTYSWEEVSLGGNEAIFLDFPTTINMRYYDGNVSGTNLEFATILYNYLSTGKNVIVRTSLVNYTIGKETIYCTPWINDTGTNVITIQSGYIGKGTDGQSTYLAQIKINLDYTTGRWFMYSDYNSVGVIGNYQFNNKARNSTALATDNTKAYTPTSDYNPATKKYVDDKLTTLSGYDATKTQVLKNVQGVLQWVDEV